MAVTLTKTVLTKVKSALDTDPTNTVVASTIADILADDGVAIIDAPYDSRVVVKITNTFAGEKDVTIKSRFGTDGDLVIPMAQDEEILFTIENAQFMNFNEDDALDAFGKIYMTFEADMAGDVEVYVVQK